jgi:hypothetical protein
MRDDRIGARTCEVDVDRLANTKRRGACLGVMQLAPIAPHPLIEDK